MSENVGQAVVAGVRDLLPALRERAQEAEDARVVPAESVKALAETGFFRLLQPARFGGLEADPLTFLTAVRLIASACGSTGWVGSVLGVHPWQLALFPLAAQEEVWGADAGTRMSSSYAPTGRAQAADGGHRLSGRWSFSSGSAHATWVLLGGIVTDAEGRPAESANTTSLVPNACTACGPGARNSPASPRQCQPRANLAGGGPAMMPRTPLRLVMEASTH